MAFSIIIQNNKSPNNKFNKSLENIATLDCVLKDNTDIINPIIIVNGNLSDFKYANYITCTTFGRSYFISDIKSIKNSIVEISCHVDVISSFKSQILSNKAIIKRSENDWNLYLNDGSLKVYQNPNIITKQFPNAMIGEAFILAVAGGISAQAES